MRKPALAPALGVTVVEMALGYSKRQPAEATVWENVSRSAGYADPIPRSTSRRGAPACLGKRVRFSGGGEVPAVAGQPVWAGPGVAVSLVIRGLSVAGERWVSPVVS
jgi:hypothetical protein